jgi:hypothetical protein
LTGGGRAVNKYDFEDIFKMMKGKGMEEINPFLFKKLNPISYHTLILDRHYIPCMVK